MEVQGEIHFVPTKNCPLSLSSFHLLKPHNRNARVTLAQVGSHREYLKLAEQIEILEDQGAVQPAIRKV